MFATLHQSCWWNHWPLSQCVRKHCTGTWRKVLGSADFYNCNNRYFSSGKSFHYLSKTFATWDFHLLSYSHLRALQKRLIARKLGLHSSSILLQKSAPASGNGEDILEGKTGQVISDHSATSGQRSLSPSDQEVSCKTFAEEDLENIQNLAKNGSLRSKTSSWSSKNKKKLSEREFSAIKGSQDLSSRKKTQLSPGKMMNILSDFGKDEQVKKVAQKTGISGLLFEKIFLEFKRKIISQLKHGNDEMLRVLSKTYCNSVSTDGPSKLYPLFFAFARKVHPMLNCIDEVKKISDLRGPADLFLEARAVKRKIIYHAGPTNSGKTHSALARFRAANTGVYCGPLRLLATEVAKRTNEAGVLCDLLTGEDRQWAISPEEPANHIAATVEMCSTETFYDCAVIDEIQMMKDKGRGWAWTRTLLGLPCPEIHVCGEHSAVDIVQRLVASCNDEMEVYHYKRLSPLLVTSHHSLDGRLERVKPGDCVVAFSQQELYRLRREIEEKTSRKCAIIYGGLPPATKIEQESKFNDPEDECSVLVASDAIGMGLNLNIKRVVFSKLTKFDGHEVVELSPSQAKQIAGRAGRYGSNYPNGEAITLKREDSKLLHSLITTPTEDVKAAGLAPTLEQIEMLSQQLPDASLVKLYDVFESVVQLDGANYFMCDLEFKKKIAHKIRGLPLSITDQYVFSTAPLNAKTIDFAPKFAFNVCHEIELTASRLKKLIDWPPKVPRSLAQLQKLEALHEGLDFYLWLSYHFPDIFMDTEQICEMQERVQGIIGEVVSLDTLKNLTDRWRQRRSSEAYKTATVGKRQRRDAGARFRKDIRRLKGNKLLV